MQMRRARGLTLVELMTVIAVAAILAAVAIPSFTKIIATQRLKSAASNLQIALLTARSEAIKRNTNVCMSTAANNCTSTSSWNGGWYVTNGTTALGTYPAYSSLSITGPTTGVTYQGSGRISTSTNPIVSNTTNYFKVASTSISDVRCVYISPMGAPSVTSSCP